jgi:hypothetical protein
MKSQFQAVWLAESCVNVKQHARVLKLRISGGLFAIVYRPKVSCVLIVGGGLPKCGRGWFVFWGRRGVDMLSLHDALVCDAANMVPTSPYIHIMNPHLVGLSVQEVTGSGTYIVPSRHVSRKPNQMKPNHPTYSYSTSTYLLSQPI